MDLNKKLILSDAPTPILSPSVPEMDGIIIRHWRRDEGGGHSLLKTDPLWSLCPVYLLASKVINYNLCSHAR